MDKKTCSKRIKKATLQHCLGGLYVRLNGISWTSLGTWFMRLLHSRIIGRNSKNIWTLRAKQIKEFFPPKFQNIRGSIYHCGSCRPISESQTCPADALVGLVDLEILLPLIFSINRFEKYKICEDRSVNFISYIWRKQDWY